MKKLIRIIVTCLTKIGFIDLTKCLFEKISHLCDFCVTSYYAAKMHQQDIFEINYGRPIYISGFEHIKIGERTKIGRLSRLDAVSKWKEQKFSPKFTIGHDSVINPLCHIGCINNVTIGNYVSIGERTYITDHIHGKSDYVDMSIPPRERPLFSKGPVVIEDYVTIGENSCILPGVTIGHNSIIGANAVVTKSVPPFSIVGGNPAKVLKIVEPEAYL